jgi:hypothetical protein
MERQERRTRIAARLTGLTLVDELDCSNRLIDKAIEIYEDSTIRYLGPEECTKMEMELRGMKKDPMFLPDAGGIVRMRTVANESQADVTTELKLSFAYSRRGLALEMGDVMSYENHQKLAAKLIGALLAEPPPGYAKIDMEQVLRADLVAWKLVAQRTRDGVKRNVSGFRPCDLIIDTVLGLQEFAQALNFMQLGERKGEHKRPRNEDADEASAQDSNRRRKRSKGDKIKDLKSQLEASKRRDNRRDGASAPRASTTTVNLPRQLIGKLAQTADQPPKRLCFAYNMTVGCRGAQDGQQCAKGWHLCMEPPGPCARAHPCHQH